jgi:hypothetical protein
MNKLITLTLIAILATTTLVLALSQQQSLAAKILPGGVNLQVISPEEGKIYNTKGVLFDVSTIGNVVLKTIKTTDTFNGKRARTLCTKCSLYLRKKSLKDGFHELTFIGTHALGNQQNKTVSFIVDSKKPKIRSTEPTRGLVSGDFHVKFREENPQTLFLNYGNSLTGFNSQMINLSECMDDGKNVECWTKVNISDYDMQEISYNFSLTDISNFIDTSKDRTLVVDTLNPKINSFNFTQNGRFINFNMNITEKNLDIIHYIDQESSRPRFKRLCTNLQNDICEKRKSFRKGPHNLTIEILDDAKNSVKIENIIFNVS